MQRRLQESVDEITRLRGTLGAVIDSLPSLILVVDRDGVVEQWNRRVEQFSGIAADDALGRQAAMLLPQFAGHLSCCTEVIEQRTSLAATKILVQSGQERRFYDLRIMPLEAAGNRAVVQIDDITEQVRIEELMMQTEKMMMVGSLVAGMAHEINNPLGAILQHAQNIERRFSPDLPANRDAANLVGISLELLGAYLEKRGITRFIEHIREAGTRASQIITSMLQFSVKGEVQPREVDLSQVVDQAIDLASNDYGLKKNHVFRSVSIVRDYDRSLPLVPLVVSEIQRVVLNMVMNAVQALSAEGAGHQPLITVRTRREGEQALLAIEDNGPGMDEITRHRIFEPFFTTKPVGVGTGLGLSISYAIITKHHQGTIEVLSNPGQGSCFLIRLPLIGAA